MIETFTQAELPYPKDFDGVRLWSYAHMNLIMPWFFVHYETKVEGILVTCQFLLFHNQQIIELDRDDSITIKAIYLVFPSATDGAIKWSMDVIDSISIGFDKSQVEPPKLTKYELSQSIYYYPEIKNSSSFRKTAEIFKSKN